MNCNCTEDIGKKQCVKQLGTDTEWICPNDDLLLILEPILFCHNGTTYYGVHTGSKFKTGRGCTEKLFKAKDCFWMHLPTPVQEVVE